MQHKDMRCAASGATQPKSNATHKCVYKSCMQQQFSELQQMQIKKELIYFPDFAVPILEVVTPMACEDSSLA